MGPKIETITIPDFFSGEGIEIDVRRPDFARILTSPFDYSGLVYEVRQVFGEMDYTPAKVKKANEEEETKFMIEMIDDLVAKTLVSPTYAEFEETMPLDSTQKGEIFDYVRAEIEDLRELIRNKDRAMMVAVQAKKARKEAADIIDPYFTLSGVGRVSFNRAMAEYLLFLEDEKTPVDFSKASKKGVQSPVDFFSEIGVAEAGQTQVKSTGGLDNTMALMMQAAEKTRKG